MKIERFLKAEPANIAALTKGYTYQHNHDYQIMMVKTYPLEDTTYALFPQKTNKYELSEFGKEYQHKIKQEKFIPQYSAIIDTILWFSPEEEIKKRILTSLCESDFFRIWKPEAPLQYFNNTRNAYIILFRVYLMRSLFNLSTVDQQTKQTASRITHFKLHDPLENIIFKPVLPDDLFQSKKEGIIEILKRTAPNQFGLYQDKSKYLEQLNAEYLNQYSFSKEEKSNIIQISEEVSLLSITDTEKESIVKTRVGQTYFRSKLLEKYGKCQLCEIDDERLLTASHIKAWAKSSNEERTDLNNGLLLCPVHDALFDKYLISFKEDGKIQISGTIPQEKYLFLKIDINSKIEITDYNRNYFKWHLSKLL
ncbi:MAG: HNH endonuclease [bacterium]|nr:HNH endonuclease [bacterium]